MENKLENAIESGVIGVKSAVREAAVSYRAYRYRWVILGIYMFAAALTQLYWLNFSAIDTYMESNMHVSAMNTGMLTLVFPIVYIVLSLPSGILVDKKGYKYAVGIGVALTGAFSLLRIFNSGSYTMLLISQIGIAAGQPFVLNGITKLVITWFPVQEEATAVGLGSLSMLAGMIIGLGITPLLVQSTGFDKMVLVYGILGGLGIVSFFLLARSKPPTPPRELKEENISIREGLTKILKMKNFVILGFVSLIGIGVFNGLATWLEKIMDELQHINMVNAGSISALMVLAGIIGCVVIPMMSDRMKKRKPFLVLAAFIGAICVTILMIKGNFVTNTINAMVLGFFLLAAFPIMLTMSLEITGEKYAGVSAAYLQLLGNGAAIAIVPLIELLRNISGGYILPLAFIAGLLFIAVLTATRIKETIKT